MKKVILVLTLVVFSFAGVVNADTWVNGYTKKNGTYVQGHYRSSPDAYKWNNKNYNK